MFKVSLLDNIFSCKQNSPTQPGVGRADYHAWMSIDSDGEYSYKIENASCTCPAGFVTACSHISFVGYVVVMTWTQGFAEKSVKGFPVSWSKEATSSAVDHHTTLKEIYFYAQIKINQ